MLYVPGQRADLLVKAVAGRADAVIADWEDAVPVTAKADARAVTCNWLAANAAGAAALWVRINADGFRPADVDALRRVAGLTGVVLAKTDGAADVDSFLEMWGSEPPPVEAIVESARGLENVTEIAAHGAVTRLHIGEYDLAADLGVDVDQAADLLGWARAKIVVTSISHGLSAPVGPVSIITKDLDAFAASTLRLLEQGFQSRACIHPAQVVVAGDVFTPADVQVTEAITLIELAERHANQGVGAFTDANGRMIDRAVIRNAHNILARAQRG